MSEHEGRKPSEPPDYLSDFPEEFEQRKDGPARDQARRKRAAAERDAAKKVAPDSALARIEAMKQRMRDLGKKS